MDAVDFGERPDFENEPIDQKIRRFVAILSRRWPIIVVCVAIGLLATGIKHTRSKPLYRADSALMVQKNASSSETDYLGMELKGYSELFASDAVLSAALAELESLPPELDASHAKEYWPSELLEILRIAPRRSSNIIDLSCESESPQACVDVLNAIVDASLSVFGEAQKNQAFELLSDLDSERVQIFKELQEKELSLLQAKKQCGDIGANSSTASHPVVQRALELNNELLAAQKERINKKALLSQVQSTIETQGDLLQHIEAFETILGRQFELTPLGLTKRESDQIAIVLQEVRDKEKLYADVDKFYGPAHPKNARAREELEKSRMRATQIQSQIHNGVHDEQLAKRMTEILRVSIDNAKKHEEAIQAEYETAEKAAIELNDQLAKVAMLEGELQTLQDRHQSLLTRIADIDVNTQRSSFQIMVVSDATLPTSPHSPNLKTTIAGGFGAGLVLSALLIVSLELLGGRFQSTEQMERELELQVLVRVGKLRATAARGLESIQTFQDPSDNDCEAFRTLRASLGLSRQETACLAFTSSEPGDGKTTVSSNLGVSFAQANRRCLIIDADMRKPGLTKLLDQRGVAGLSDVLRSDSQTIEATTKCIQSTAQKNLDVLPCGSKPADPAALLASPRMEELLGWAISQYDQVLIDCPPALVSADASIIARVSDAIALVVNPDKNKRKTVMRAKAVLGRSDCNVIGAVLNGAEFAADKAYYGYGYGYGSEETTSDSQTSNQDQAPATISFPSQQVAQSESKPTSQKAA